ncbi:unnamed protein product, partial [Rotaria magnacalcarata]
MNLRYEAKHHLLKQIANRGNHFINLPYTISKRVQLRQCYELIDENAFRLNNVSGKIRTRRTIIFHKSIQNALIEDSPFIYGDIVEFVKWVLIDNVKYKVGDFFVAHLLGGEEIPLFVKIKFIIHIVQQWRFIVQCYDTIAFRQNLWYYEIRPSNNNNILNKFSMDWSHQDVSMRLTENGFDKYIDKFKEEKINGFSLLNLSSSSIDELLSIKTVDNIIKKPTIGFKTTFEKKLEVLKADIISSSSNIMTLNDKQSDVLIQEINSNLSNNLSFFHNLSFDTEHVVIDNQDHLNGSLSNSYVSDQLNGQSSSNPTFLPPSNVATNETIHRSLYNSSIISISQPKKIFPLNYVLPKFDKAFEKVAENPSTADFELRCRKKQQLIKTIRDDIVNTYGVDFYPTASEFDQMIVSVKNKYPVLSKVFGEDMSLLTSALKQQFSREGQQYTEKKRFHAELKRFRGALQYFK